MKVWIALVQDVESTVARVATTKQAGLRWLVEQIPLDAWHAWHAALVNDGQVDGLVRDRDKNDPQALIETYVGPMHATSYPDGEKPEHVGRSMMWGEDMYFMALEEQTLLGPLDARGKEDR